MRIERFDEVHERKRSWARRVDGGRSIELGPGDCFARLERITGRFEAGYETPLRMPRTYLRRGQKRIK
jgi:hypothetical protein